LFLSSVTVDPTASFSITSLVPSKATPGALVATVESGPQKFSRSRLFRRGRSEPKPRRAAPRRQPTASLPALVDEAALGELLAPLRTTFRVGDGLPWILNSKNAAPTMVFATMCALTVLFQLFALPDALFRAVAAAPALAKAALAALADPAGLAAAAWSGLAAPAAAAWSSVAASGAAAAALPKAAVAAAQSSYAAAGALPKAAVAAAQTVGASLIPKRAALRAWRGAKAAPERAALRAWRGAKAALGFRASGDPRTL
jgi:hypothetical protein